MTSSDNPINWRDEMNTISFESTAPAITNVPKVTSSIRLFEMSISVWTGRKQDKAASAAAATAHGADKRLLNTSKSLLGDCAELDAVRKFAANARNFVYSSTTAWGDLGQRFLPMATFPKFHGEITGLQVEFDRLVEEFLSVYEFARAQAQAKLGALFNADEYPDVNVLRSKFKFVIAYPPVPEANIFSNIQDEAEKYLASEYAKHYTERIEASMREVWDRVYDALKHMSERLDYQGGDTKDKKIFRDSMLENIRELAAMLPAFNVTGDSRLSRLHMELDQALIGVTPDALREDDGFRKDTKSRVDGILKSMSW
jgi:hypothetical protein